MEKMNVVNQNIIPEFSSGSSTHAVAQETTKRQAWKSLKQVQGLSNNKISGFTLIELLVVVLIIGILAAIALPQYQKSVEKARAAEAVTRISQLEKAINLWKLTNPGEECDDFLGEDSGVKCSPLDIEFPCKMIWGDCHAQDFSYQARPSEIMAYAEGSHYYVLHVKLNTKRRICGWFDSIGKAVCDGLAANGGWESIEKYDV